MIYRPTVRYHSIFKTYVDNLFNSTHLDRNQIIRAALFAAAHSKEFQELILGNKKPDVPLPRPNWTLEQAVLWREKNPEMTREEGDVHEQAEKKTSTIARPAGAVSERIRTTGGGITIKIGQKN